MKNEKNLDGATGTVIMDDLADQAPQFAAFFISPFKDKALKIILIDSYRLPNCDGILNRTGCLNLVCKNSIFNFFLIFRK